MRKILVVIIVDVKVIVFAAYIWYMARLFDALGEINAQALGGFEVDHRNVVDIFDVVDLVLYLHDR